MTDYASMTDEQINRTIADKLGFEVISVSNKFGVWWALRDGEGTYYEDGIDNYYPPNRRTVESAWDDLPDWSQDLNKAIGLIPTHENNDFINLKFSLEYLVFSKVWLVTLWGKSLKRYDADHPHNPARAICEAWLKWKDSQNGK